MSTTEKKPQPTPGQTNPPSPSSAAGQGSSTSTKTAQSPPSKAQLASTQPSRGPLISRRAFLLGAVIGSAGLAAGAFATSGGILSPLVPPAKGESLIATSAELDQALATGTDVVRGPAGDAMPYKFFYWPYDPSVSPYYRNVLARVPDSIASQTSSGAGKYVAYNTTCVHLQCLVNPGFADGQYRLQCPCHGSQYEITDGVPQRGPAHDLNLGRLPRVRLKVDSNGNIYAEPWDSSDNLEGVPGLGLH